MGRCAAAIYPFIRFFKLPCRGPVSLSPPDSFVVVSLIISANSSYQPIRQSIQISISEHSISGIMQFFGGSEISPSPPIPTASGNNVHLMYIFNRNGVCLLYKEWNRPLRTLNPQQDQKLIFGLLFSLKSFTAKIDPTSADKGNLGVPQLLGQGCSFHSFRTNTYKLSFMESPSGIKIILVTNPRTNDLREPLKYIYNLYVEYVVKNPLYNPGTLIRSELFNTSLNQYIRSIS